MTPPDQPIKVPSYPPPRVTPRPKAEREYFWRAR